MRVLLLTHRLPYAPNRGDRVRAFHLVRTLVSRVDLDIVSLVHDRHEAEQVEALRVIAPRVTAVATTPARNLGRALSALPTRRPLTHVLLDGSGMRTVLDTLMRHRPPDVVLAFCSGMARFAVEPPLAHRPLVIDFVDVDSRKWATLAESAPWPKRLVYQREASCLGAFERRAAQAARASLVVNEREALELRSLAPGAEIQVVGNGIDVAALRPPLPPGDAPRVVFCGVMNYTPNVDGVLWFAREIWPRVIAAQPGARLTIVGADPTRAVRELALHLPGVAVTGRVDDVRPYLWEAAVSVAPLRAARGVQNKVLEALAAGLPAVVTPQVFAGLPREATPGCLVAADAAAFAAQVLGLLRSSPAERRAIAARAGLSSLSWDRQLGPVVDILTAAAARRLQTSAALAM